MSQLHRRALKTANVKAKPRHGRGNCRPRPNPEPVDSCIDEPKSEPTIQAIPEAPTNEKLLVWAKQMGFVPGGLLMKKDYPTAEDFKRLCRQDTQPMWEHLIRHARPKQHVAAFRQAMQVRDQVDSQVDWAQRRMEEALHEKDVEAADRQRDVAELQRMLKLMFLKQKHAEKQTEELEKKTVMLSLRASDLHDLIRQDLEYLEMAYNLLPYRRGKEEGEPEQTGEPRGVVCLRECLALVAQTHDKHYRLMTAGTSGDSGGMHQDKEALHQLVAARMREHTAAELWTSLHHLRGELVGKLEQLEEKLDPRKEHERIRAQLNAENVVPLPAALDDMWAMLLREQHLRQEQRLRTASMADTLEAAYRECATLIGNQLRSLNVSCLPDDSLLDEWLTLKVNVEKETTAQKHLREGIKLPCMKMEDCAETQRSLDSSKERLAIIKRELQACRERLEHDMPCLRGTTSKLQAMHASLVEQTERMSGNGNGPALGQLVTATQGHTYAEVKEVIDLPLEMLETVTLQSGEKVLKRDLLTEYTHSLASLSSTRERYSELDHVMEALDGAPCLPVENVLLGLHKKLEYLAQVKQVLGQIRVAEPFECVDVRSLKTPGRTLDAQNLLHLSHANELLSSTEVHVAHLRTLARVYEEHPARQAVPPQMAVNGKTLREWQQEYDEICRKAV